MALVVAGAPVLSGCSEQAGSGATTATYSPNFRSDVEANRAGAQKWWDSQSAAAQSRLCTEQWRPDPDGFILRLEARSRTMGLNQGESAAVGMAWREMLEAECGPSVPPGEPGL